MQGKLMGLGSVIWVMLVSSLPGASLVIASLGRAGDKVRGGMSGICIHQCVCQHSSMGNLESRSCGLI